MAGFETSWLSSEAMGSAQHYRLNGATQSKPKPPPESGGLRRVLPNQANALVNEA